jgi:glyoxylase-like metal-dependent hydrolase (beta-lactamase superfamily II)
MVKKGEIMADNPRSFQLGSATITLFDTGALRVNLAEWIPLPPEEWPPTYAGDFSQPINVPIWCLHITLPEGSILVDACDPESIGHSGHAPPGYEPPPSLTAQLAAAGIRPETVEQVVITHSHLDHYNGLAEQGQLCFPQARHYLGQGDWNQLQADLQQPDSLASQTLGLAQRAGRLELVERMLDLAEGVQLIPAPGESPGHQIVRLQSEGQTFYYLGDLYHHPVEVDYPEWRVHWAEAETTRRSRQALMAAALAEEALLIATHIPTPGRLKETPAGVVWEPVSLGSL